MNDVIDIAVEDLVPIDMRPQSIKKVKDYYRTVQFFEWFILCEWNRRLESAAAVRRTLSTALTVCAKHTKCRKFHNYNVAFCHAQCDFSCIRLLLYFDCNTLQTQFRLNCNAIRSSKMLCLRKRFNGLSSEFLAHYDKCIKNLKRLQNGCYISAYIMTLPVDLSYNRPKFQQLLSKSKQRGK